MNLVVDENISFGQEAFSQFGNVKLLHGRKIINEELKNADVLIVRSITKVNKELLENTPVKFVGTATIGTDHIDLEYLNSRGIYFKDAAGCNADAVTEYVFTSILNFAVDNSFSIEGQSIGVIGIGNIGSRISRLAEWLGMDVLKNDPPQQRKTGDQDYVSLEEALRADIITFHVPLNLDGIDKTFHLIDERKLSTLREKQIIINASRGQVIDNPVLLKFISEKNLLVNLDVWENEPAINVNLLNWVHLASPHIAGYSLEGKINGTVIIYKALCNFLNAAATWSPFLPEVQNNEIKINYDGNLTKTLHEIFNSVYPIKEDDSRMRAMKNMKDKDRAAYFDKLRKEYPLRREFKNYKVTLSNADEKIVNALRKFRFYVEAN